jgi:hypothetical protein
MKQTSVLLYEKQIDFLKNLCKRIEKEGHKKMSRCKIMNVLTKTLTCIKTADVHECRSEEEIERQLLKCLKKAVTELKK